MRLVLIADTFPPLTTSGAVQLRDLAGEFIRQGHDLTVLIPSHTISGQFVVEDFDGTTVVRLRAPQTKDIGYVKRTLGELFMPFVMLFHLRQSPLANHTWDGIIWYSPSIFLAP
ncbi:MAG: glycosyltransferase family 4 protein [Gammaproteobacteria bacterium]|nr:glycosyltransferase family 4 protein [Gammaproteobacteria bacterium]